jgi:hypothetical protein
MLKSSFFFIFFPYEIYFLPLQHLIYPKLKKPQPNLDSGPTTPSSRNIVIFLDPTYTNVYILNLV